MEIHTDLPRLDPFAVRLLNSITAPGRYHRCSVEDKAMVFQAVPDHAETSSSILLNLSIGGQPARLNFSLSPSGFWKGRLLDELAMSPEPLRTALNAAIFGEFIEFLESALNLEITIEAQAAPEAGIPFRLPWTVTDEDGQTHACGAMSFGPILGESLIRAMSGWSRKFPETPHSIALPALAVIASFPIPLRDIQAMEPGDFIVLDSEKFLETKIADLLVCGQKLFQARFPDQSINVKNFKVSPDMSSFTEQDSPQADAGWAQDIEVELQFVAGSCELSVSELAKLVPGQVIELNQAASDPLEIRVNGRKIGAGHLVRIGEQLGVQVSEIRKNLP